MATMYRNGYYQQQTAESTGTGASVIESQNGLGWKRPQSPPSSNPLLWAGLPTTRSACPSNRALSASRDGALQLLWAAHLSYATADVGIPSQGSAFGCWSPSLSASAHTFFR